MKMFVYVMLALALMVTCKSPPVDGVIGVQTFKEYMPRNTEDKRFVIDVRTQEEFDQGHARGAKNVDYFDPDFVNKMEVLYPKEDTLLLYCKSGNRSAKALKLLKAKGYKSVYALDASFKELIFTE